MARSRKAQTPPHARGVLCAAAAALTLASASACATVGPEQRAFLADPMMQFDSEARHDAALRHAQDNREGSMGGHGVAGGGCGCN